MVAARRNAHRSKLPEIVRNLILVLGDQLDLASAAFDGFDAKQDAVWMAEVCPSEVARAMAEDWRGLMPFIRQEGARLVARRAVRSDFSHRDRHASMPSRRAFPCISQ